MVTRCVQEHTNTIRRFQFVSLQEAAAYVAKSEKPGGAPPQQEATTVQPSLDWSLILESLDLTPHQSKVHSPVWNSIFLLGTAAQYSL